MKKLFILILSAVVLGLWILCPVIISWIYNESGFEAQYSALNTLFSGFAFIGVIAAIVLQSQELSLQRKELELQREEMAKTAGALLKQVDILFDQEVARKYDARPLFNWMVANFIIDNSNIQQGELIIRAEKPINCRRLSIKGGSEGVFVIEEHPFREHRDMRRVHYNVDIKGVVQIDTSVRILLEVINNFGDEYTDEIIIVYDDESRNFRVCEFNLL